MRSFLANSSVYMSRNCESAEGHGYDSHAGICGKGLYVQLWQDFKEGVIKRTGYQCAECFSSIVCAKMDASFLIGRSL